LLACDYVSLEYRDKILYEEDNNDKGTVETAYRYYTGHQWVDNKEKSNYLNYLHGKLIE
jgi:hypothetical protein